MTLASMGVMRWPDINLAATLFYGCLIDASGEKAAHVFYSPSADPITGAGIRHWAAGNPQTIKCSLQGVDAAGKPDGTIKGAGNSVYGTYTPAASTWSDCVFGTAYTPSIGEALALVWEHSGTVGSTSFTMCMPNDYRTHVAHAFGQHFVSSAWSRQIFYGYPAQLACAVNQGGVYRPGISMPCASDTQVLSVSEDTTPDEVGNVLTVPFGCRVIGVYGHFFAPRSTNDALILYDSSSNVLGTGPLQKHQSIDLTSTYSYGTPMHYAYFTPVALTAGGSVRVVFKPGATGTNVLYNDVHAQAKLGGYTGLTTCHSTTRTNGGAWTDLVTRLYGMGLLVDQLSDDSKEIVYRYPFPPFTP